MAEEKEILRYELDVTDVEAKSKRIQDLLSKIGTGRAAGQNTDELSQQLHRELDTLDKSRGKTVEAQTAIEKLSRSKRDLADVVSLLGGRFGGLIGDVDGVIQVLGGVGGGGLVTAAGAALAAITLLVHQIATMREELKKLREEEKKYAEAELSKKQRGVGEAAAIAERLQALGARSPQNTVAAYEASRRAQAQYGLSAGQTDQAAALAVSMGITDPQQVGQIALAMSQGMPGTPQAVKRFFASPAMSGELNRQLGQITDDPIAAANRLKVAREGTRFPSINSEEDLYAHLKDNGLLPEGVTSVQGFKEGLGKARLAREEMTRLRPLALEHRASRADIWGWAKSSVERRYEDLLEENRGLLGALDQLPAADQFIGPAPLGDSPQATTPGAQQVIQHVTINQENVGTKYQQGMNPLFDARYTPAQSAPGAGGVGRSRP